MALVEKTVLIEQSAERMFELVDRCEDYPAFLPWCSHTEVKFRDATRTVGTLHINYHAVKSSFTTENDKEFPSLMHIRLVDGPFRKLHGRWDFHALDESACKVTLTLEFEPSSRLLGPAMALGFQGLADRMVDDFVRAADRGE